MYPGLGSRQIYLLNDSQMISVSTPFSVARLGAAHSSSSSISIMRSMLTRADLDEPLSQAPHGTWRGPVDSEGRIVEHTIGPQDRPGGGLLKYRRSLPRPMQPRRSLLVFNRRWAVPRWPLPWIADNARKRTPRLRFWTTILIASWVGAARLVGRNDVVYVGYAMFLANTSISNKAGRG